MKYFEVGKQVLETLNIHGYEAYFVGGFVRDFLLGNYSDDIDITTNATPDQVIKLFNNVKETGKKYGTVTVIIDSFRYEVTTFRTDGNYRDNRHPDSVRFSRKLEDDLKRRDFTINALVMDKDEVVRDFHDGKIDLENKLIRTIDNPIQRFNEDALRMMRAFRFVSKLGFDLEQETLDAVFTLKDLIYNVSIERIMVELDKTFKGKHLKKAISYLVSSGLHGELYGLKNGLEYLNKIDFDLYPLEIFILCFILGEDNSIWRFSNKSRRLIESVMQLHEVTKEGKFNKFIIFSYKLEVCLIANKISKTLGYEDQEQRIKELADDMVVKDVCDLAFKGQDILQLTTLKKRSVIALVIDDLLYNVIMGIMPNDYDTLKQFALKRVEELQNEMERV